MVLLIGIELIAIRGLIVVSWFDFTIQLIIGASRVDILNISFLDWVFTISLMVFTFESILVVA
jgi:hypothetical protein